MPPLPVELPVFPPIDAALFDLDGTLVETHIDFSAMSSAMRRVAASVGVPEAEQAGKDILGLVDLAVEYAKKGGRDPSVVRADSYSVLEQMEVSGCAHATLLPGTSDLLSRLHERGVKIGIVTRNCRAVALALLQQFEIPFDVLLSRDDVSRAKPHPQHLWDALEALSVPPDRAVMVGDHPMDIAAGLAAGVASTLAVFGGLGRDRFLDTRPTAMVADLSEALPLFSVAF